MQSSFFSGFLFIFVLISVTIVGRFIMSYWTSTNGWANLAKDYKVSSEIEGEKLSFIYMVMGRAIYKHCVVLIYNDEGLYMRLPFIYKMFHSPLYIPWNQIQYIKEKSFDRHEIGLGSYCTSTIIINNNTFTKLQNHIEK